MKQSNKAILLGGVAVLSWSTVATAFKIALSQLSVFETLLIASLTALIGFTAVMTVERRWHELRQVNRRDLGLMMLGGAINPTVYYLVLFESYDLLPAQIAQPINYIWPILLLLLLAVFRHKPVAPRKFIGMAVSLAGVATISLGGKEISGTISLPGLLLGALSALFWASYWMINDTLKDRVSQSLNLWTGFATGSAILLLASIFVPVSVTSWPALLSGVYVGMFEIAVPFACFGMAIRLTDNPALINQMCYLAPFMSLFLIHMVLGEPIMTTTYIGLILIVGGIVYNTYFAESARKVCA